MTTVLNEQIFWPKRRFQIGGLMMEWLLSKKFFGHMSRYRYFYWYFP